MDALPCGCPAEAWFCVGGVPVKSSMALMGEFVSGGLDGPCPLKAHDPANSPIFYGGTSIHQPNNRLPLS